MANPILDAHGNVDKDASRRVEVKFRLKDDEMIQELNEIMSSDQGNAAEEGGAETAQTEASASPAAEKDTAEASGEAAAETDQST